MIDYVVCLSVCVRIPASEDLRREVKEVREEETSTERKAATEIESERETRGERKSTDQQS